MQTHKKMKSTDNFKTIIADKLQQMGKEDSLFAVKLKNIKKNIDDCITYILNTVKKSGCCGFTDDEVFGMAAHYYDEENIEVGKPVDCNVVVNHSIPKPTTTTTTTTTPQPSTTKPSINKTVMAPANKPSTNPAPTVSGLKPKTSENQSEFTQLSMF
jgi:hypothetical protein